MAEFLLGNPGLTEFETAIKEYQTIESTVQEIPATIRVAAIELVTDPLRLSLIAETTAWKNDFGKNLNKKASTDMQAIFTFCGKISKVFTRKVTDLDDVRLAMAV